MEDSYRELDIPVHQINTKFVNNLPPYWAKYVTNVKNNKDISATTYVELYTYLKSYEPHPMKTLKKKKQSSSIVDPLIVTKTVQRKASSNVGNTGTRGTQSYGQVTDNKGKLVICYNYCGEGHVSRQCKEKKIVKDYLNFKDKMMLMEAKENGAVLDAKAEAFLADVECTAPYDQPLAIKTTNIFEVSHEDAYDSDVDEGPHAAAAFMGNLSSISGTNGATTSHVNKVHTDDNQIFDNVKHLLAHEMHQEEHLDSDVESDIDKNTIQYHQYQLDSEKELSREQVYWLPAEELATQKSNPPKPVTLFVHTYPAPSKDQLQGKDDTIRKLHTQINNMSMLNVEPTVGSFDKQALETELTPLKDAITSVRIQNNGFKVENVNLKQHYQELSTSNSHSRDMLTRKIIALTVENAKLKSKTLSKMHRKPIVPEKPKVLAPGMYAISSKYIVPPRRVNRAEPTHLPKKKQATFQEPPDLQIDPHKKQ
nr:hypothetical protein [Tanacetum cinerariifolium]